jgi:hypothetical protein
MGRLLRWVITHPTKSPINSRGRDRKQVLKGEPGSLPCETFEVFEMPGRD